MTNRKETATFLLSKTGASGRPAVEVALVGSGTMADVSAALVKNVTRNAEILKKVGLKARPACTSGFDIWIRHRFDDVLTGEAVRESHCDAGSQARYPAIPASDCSSTPRLRISFVRIVNNWIMLPLFQIEQGSITAPDTGDVLRSCRFRSPRLSRLHTGCRLRCRLWKWKSGTALWRPAGIECDHSTDFVSALF